MTQSTDLLQHLADIAPESPLAQARAVREAATQHTQGSYEALFNAEDSAGLPRAVRVALAAQIARWHAEDRLADHYATLQPDSLSDKRWQDALAHAERLAFHPASAAPEHLYQLQKSGWSETDIVTLSQLIAFVSFQSRLLRGYRLLAGEKVPEVSTAPAVASEWRTETLTVSRQPAPPVFTRDELGWEPWIAPKALEAFTPEEQATLARFGHTESDYFRLLGRNLPLLEQRTLTDKGIFFTPEGLPRKERELAATVASKVNGCVFCASVHARKAAQLAKQPEEVDRLLAIEPGQVLAQNQEPRWLALIDFAASLSATPPTPRAAQLATLHELGLSDLELLDLVQSTAFFAWANRLMLTLGEPFVPA